MLALKARVIARYFRAMKRDSAYRLRDLQERADLFTIWNTLLKAAF
jgi:hypothetical protein